VQMAYLPYPAKKSIPFISGRFLPFIPVIDVFEFLDPLDQVFQFGVIDLDLSLDRVQFPQQLFDPHIHDIHDELLEKNRNNEDHQDISFI
jgi:hypothetical protein